MSSYIDEVREWQKQNLPDHSREAASKRLRDRYDLMTEKEKRVYLRRRLAACQRHGSQPHDWETEEADRLGVI